MLATRENYKEAESLFNEFLDKYVDLYPKGARQFLKENFYRFYFENYAPDIFMQIFEFIGIEKPQPNFYQAHFDRVNEFYDLGTNVVEVGSGFIPVFANRIASLQSEFGKGTITIYDPELIFKDSKYANMTLHKDLFTRNTDTSSSNLIIGLLPCEATYPIIENACKNNIDFYLAMCGCVHGDYGYPISPEFYQDITMDYAEKLIKKNDMGELIVDRLPDEYAIDYPILRNKRK